VKAIMILVVVMVGLVAQTAQAIPMFGLYPVMPVDLTIAARDLAQIADDVVSKQAQCSGENRHGAYAEGGGCNRFGCWPAGGSCNEHGCSISGSCDEKGCEAKIETFRCERRVAQGQGA
jgi:hypothetical protein